MTVTVNSRRRDSKMGDKNPMWKGNNVGYYALHEWVRNHKPRPSLCERCHTKPPHDLTNVSQAYHRDLSDWRWMCRTCHMISDGRLAQLQENHKEYQCPRCGRFVSRNSKLCLECMEAKSAQV